MFEANPGDKLEVSVDLDGETLTKYLWVVEHPDTKELWTWHHYDPSAPRVPLASLQEGLFGLRFKIAEAAAEQLPVVAGKYLSVELLQVAARHVSRMIMEEPTFDVDKFYETEVWPTAFTLSADGVWTDYEGAVCQPWEVIVMTCGLTLMEA